MAHLNSYNDSSSSENILNCNNRMREEEESYSCTSMDAPVQKQQFMSQSLCRKKFVFFIFNKIFFKI